jgi:hypothetical protein
VKALGSHSTDLQRAKVLERSSRLWRKIEAWMAIQQLYMPGVAGMRAQVERAGGDEPISAVNINLFLPSHTIGHFCCPTEYLEYEWRLRYAQAHDILHEIRRQLILRAQMYKSKRRYTRGQYMQTRSLTVINGVQSKINAAVTKYRYIRGTLSALASPLVKIGWEDGLRVLADTDVRGLTAEENPGSEGHRTMAWIWKTNLGEVVGVDGVGVLQTQEGT